MSFTWHDPKGGGVSAILPPDQNSLTLLMTERHQVAEFKKLVARAMNTWDDAPEWAKKLDRQLSGVPEPVGRPVDKPA